MNITTDAYSQYGLKNIDTLGIVVNVTTLCALIIEGDYD
jgi:hypothetical protein